MEVVNRSYAVLSNLFSDPLGDAVIERLQQFDPVEKWNDPEGRSFERGLVVSFRLTVPLPISPAPAA
jgi:hypothetical protein